ncbi:MAG TPA: R3H domain-containing nucleic acid-binding protein [Terriglobia bacterium]|nr:R3H domain-containing nucleic acid-binding protein [Terriglobia bacterium]
MDTDHPPAEHAIEKYLSSMESLLHKVMEHSPFELTFSIQKAAAQAADPEAPEYVVDFSGADADLLLEKNATLLHAIEFVVLKAIRLDEDHFRRIVFDCQDWRRTRMEELRLMAQVAAERVIETGDPFTLNPMSPRERRIVHMALRDRPQVRTESEGMGPERKVVIFPAK